MLNWTPLSGQMQDSHKDSTICYSQQELRVISLKLIEGNECDELLKISDELNQFKDSVITSQDSIINKQILKIAIKDTIIIKQDKEVSDLNNQIKKDHRKLVWTKIGWASTTTLLTAIMLYTLFHL